jgi:hypothetical protein
MHLKVRYQGVVRSAFSRYLSPINTPGSTNIFNTYLVLVVPDSNYNQHIPLLIGTNILNTILQDLHQLHGDKYLQNADLTTRCW